MLGVRAEGCCIRVLWSRKKSSEVRRYFNLQDDHGSADENPYAYSLKGVALEARFKIRNNST